MIKEEYEKMALEEGSYWWHCGKKELLSAILNTYFPNNDKRLNILEIGCGTGDVSKILDNYGTVTGLDISSEAIKFYKKNRGNDYILGDINSIDLVTLADKFDLIVSLDVLEHIQEDTETMRRAYMLLKDDGIFIVNVPAYKFLWSEHDEALHHKRRYHSLELRKKLEDSGFFITKLTHFVGTFFLPIALYRLTSNFIKKNPYPKTSYVNLPKKLNDFMAFLLKIEAKIVNRLNNPIGTTLVAVAKKKPK